MEDIPFIVWLEDRDGGSIRCEAYDTTDEILKARPLAKQISEYEFEAWIGDVP